jgi:hypothetical protein
LLTFAKLTPSKNPANKRNPEATMNEAESRAEYIDPA